jgi:DNA-directed RNA polymerase specialized sigma24 family protein
MSPFSRPRPEFYGDRDFDLTPDLEAVINTLANAGREDPAARNELFALLSGKVARFIAPWEGKPLALGDVADLRQEAFLVFADLVLGWSGEGSFARYFFGFYPWRLRHAIAHHERRWHPRRVLLVSQEALEDLAGGEADLGGEAELALGALTAKERQLLALRLADYSLPAAAARLGWSERTVARRWGVLRHRLGRMRGETSPPDPRSGAERG